MAISPERSQNVQIAVTLEEKFLNAIPDYFQLGTDMKLHHDPQKVNVFAHTKFEKNNLFADSFGEVLKFQTADEMTNIKNRLLANPIFLQVRLKREVTSGNIKYTTRGSFIVFINTQHPSIRYQLEEKLTQMQGIVFEGGNVALEIEFEKVLKQWFKANFKKSSWAFYSTENANFCITNFSQKIDACHSPCIWVVCLPCCLLCGPCYCIHRKVYGKCVDLECSINATVQYAEGESETERQELMQILARAYSEGFNDANRVIAGEPVRPVVQQPNPPPYSSVPQSQVSKII